MQSKVLYATGSSRSEALSNLEEQVKAHLKDGWKTEGGILSAGNGTEAMVCQTVVK